MTTFADLLFKVPPTNSWTGLVPKTSSPAPADPTVFQPAAPGNFQPPPPDYTQPQYINPLTAEQIRSRLFASTGGNVTQEAVDRNDSQWRVDPYATGPNRFVQASGDTGAFGGFPAQEMPADRTLPASQTGAFTNPNTVGTPYGPGQDWAKLAPPSVIAGNQQPGSPNNPTGANLGSVSAIDPTPYLNMLQPPSARPATGRGVPTSNIYGSQLGATTPAGYQSYLDTFYAILNAPKQMPNYTFTPAPTAAEMAAGNTVSPGVPGTGGAGGGGTGIGGVPYPTGYDGYGG